MTFIKHEIRKEHDEDVIVLYLDQYLYEFSDELGSLTSTNLTLKEKALSYIQKTIPNSKGRMVKVMLGTMLIGTFSVSNQVEEAEASGTSTAIVESQHAPLSIVIDGKPAQFSQQPILINGTVFIPIRGIAETLGANVWYNPESRTVGIEKVDVKIAFEIGASTARINGEVKQMQPSFVVNGTTMVPVRFVSESMDLNVEWDGANNRVLISSIPSKHLVSSGDTLWTIANKYRTTVTALKTSNNLTSDTIMVGQELILSTKNQIEPTTDPTTEQGTVQNYTVVSGDTLFGIAKKFGTSTESIKTLNGLSSDVIRVGQSLKVRTTSNIPEATTPSHNAVTYITHTVISGDNIWNLSVSYGIPQSELLKVNGLTLTSTLSIGQKLKVPQYQIAVKPVVSERHGEHLDWWTEGQYVFPIGKTFKVTDFQTGKSFMVKRTTGANHADSETVTVADSTIAKGIWGGYSWTPRAVLIEVDGRKAAASMSFFPHDVQYIKDNGITGHFDIHFKNSTRHKDGAIDLNHQKQINIAAGVR